MRPEGAMKSCIMCGKERYMGNLDGYVFKRKDNRGSGSMLYFCGWNCLRAWEKQFPEKQLREWWEE